MVVRVGTVGSFYGSRTLSFLPAINSLFEISGLLLLEDQLPCFGQINGGGTRSVAIWPSKHKTFLPLQRLLRLLTPQTAKDCLGQGDYCSGRSSMFFHKFASYFA